MEKMKDKCEICGRELNYLSPTDPSKTMNCFFCKNSFTVNTFCADGHYICDECHSKDAKEITIEFLRKTDLIDPFLIAEEIMKHPKFKMYGPEHHFLVPAVVLTALRNLKVLKPNGKPIKFKSILEAIKRGATVPGGYCGFYGSCGAGVGTGILLSVFTNANPSTDKTRSLANKLTARVLNKVADNLEHCCKRSVKYAICEALAFLKENFEIEPNLDYSPAKCSFADKNTKCEKTNCPFN